MTVYCEQTVNNSYTDCTTKTQKHYETCCTLHKEKGIAMYMNMW